MQKIAAAVLAGLVGLTLCGPALSDSRTEPGRDTGATTGPQIEPPAQFHEGPKADGFDWSAPKLKFETFAMSCSPSGLRLPDGTPLFSIVNTSGAPIPKGASLRIEWPVDQVKWFYNPEEIPPGGGFNIAPPDGIAFTAGPGCEAKATVV